MIRNNNSTGTALDFFPSKTSIWQRKSMDNEQKLANTMQLHRRRFEYLDNKVKML